MSQGPQEHRKLTRAQLSTLNKFCPECDDSRRWSLDAVELVDGPKGKVLRGKYLKDVHGIPSFVRVYSDYRMDQHYTTRELLDECIIKPTPPIEVGEVTTFEVAADEGDGRG